MRIGTVFQRLRYWCRQRELDAALQEEIEFHRALKQEELEANGLSREEARFAASEVRFVTGRYFDVLKVPVVAGRPLYAADDERGPAAAVAVVSHGLAERQFGGAAEAVGAVLRVDRVPFTIVGVAARGAKDRPLAEAPEAWLPILSAWSLRHSPAFGEACRCSDSSSIRSNAASRSSGGSPRTHRSAPRRRSSTCSRGNSPRPLTSPRPSSRCEAPPSSTTRSQRRP